MVTLTKNGFETSYDLDGMLYEDMLWLVGQVKKPVKEFESLAKQMDLTQDNWNRFWGKVRTYRAEVQDKECLINGKTKMLSADELEVAGQILGTPDVLSNCCSASIQGQDICSDCKEHCGKVYVF